MSNADATSLSLILHVTLYTRILADGFGTCPDPVCEGDARSLGERAVGLPPLLLVEEIKRVKAEIDELCGPDSGEVRRG
jgi:hypothetical protein